MSDFNPSPAWSNWPGPPTPDIVQGEVALSSTPTPLNGEVFPVKAVTMFGKKDETTANDQPAYVGNSEAQDQTLGPWDSANTGGDVAWYNGERPLDLNKIYVRGTAGDFVRYIAIKF